MKKKSAYYIYSVYFCFMHIVDSLVYFHLCGTDYFV